MRRFTPRWVAAVAAIAAAVATCAVGSGTASAAPRHATHESVAQHTMRPADWHWP